ncbi:MAG TPA: META domain-containing protein [Burkholderiaceae bacterium]|jgi:heat shock protein HslJ|nr:META domain-containing protein [Burkholderiaceae bacterium]
MNACKAAAAIAVLILAAGCASKPPVLTGRWSVTHVGGKAQPSGVKAQLEFTGDGRLAGNVGCNGVMGTYTQEGKTLKFGALGTTRRMCESPVMDQEAKLLLALERANIAAVYDDTLDLRDPLNEPLVRAVRVP